MKIFIGADHRGYKLKNKVIRFLKSRHYTVIDAGTNGDKIPCDYPKIAFKVARKVAEEKTARGILVCMTGIGHSIAANKVPGAYAALCYNKKAAILSRRHNDSNILVLGAKFVTQKDLLGIIKVWLAAKFEGGRHRRRVDQIKNIEKKYSKPQTGKR